MSQNDRALVLDASVAINLLATGHFQEILEALPEQCLLVEQVAEEVNQDPFDSANDNPLRQYVERQLIEVVSLRGEEFDTFVSLVEDPSAELDDGEAATLAVASHRRFAAAVDESKATKVSASRFPALPVLCTIDILRREEVQAVLGNGRYAEALLSALTKARMQVHGRHRAWVRGILGDTEAARFPKLMRR